MTKYASYNEMLEKVAMNPTVLRLVYQIANGNPDKYKTYEEVGIKITQLLALRALTWILDQEEKGCEITSIDENGMIEERFRSGL